MFVYWREMLVDKTGGSQFPQLELGSNKRAVTGDQGKGAQNSQRDHRLGWQQGNIPQWSSASMGWRGGDGVLTPAAHCVLAARHDIFTLLVFTRNHFKLDGCITHPMVSKKKTKTTADIS